MKRTYTKPELMFEDFSLSINIAAGCEVWATHGDSQQGCGYDLGEDFGHTVIFLNNGVCDYAVNDGYNGICYHNPSAINNVFNS